VYELDCCAAILGKECTSIEKLRKTSCGAAVEDRGTLMFLCSVDLPET
jgi:hypothetical protein